MGPFVQWMITMIIWALANIVYVDMKRKGVRGFRRLVAFWLGTPWSWLFFFFGREGRAPRFTPPPDDDDRLLREIRVDRELRGLSAPSPRQAEEGEAPEPTPEV